MKTTKVFVYGTLKEGRPLDRPMFRKARTNVEEATIAGSIFSLGPYPTIKLDDQGTVYGEVHTFHADEFDSMLSTFDMVEGYNASAPEKGLYNRHIVKATTKSGDVVEAWAYEYNGDCKAERRLDDGVWEPGR